MDTILDMDRTDGLLLLSSDELLLAAAEQIVQDEINNHHSGVVSSRQGHDVPVSTVVPIQHHELPMEAMIMVRNIQMVVYPLNGNDIRSSIIRPIRRPRR
jgi:hypothetical protein